jgi:hypothetical protein
LKSERIEIFKKRDYSISALHKIRIYEILLPSSVQKKGMTAKEIQTKLNYLSLRTVFNLLKELEEEGRVFKLKAKYYLDLFIDDGWSIFAEFLNEFQKQYHLNEIPLRKVYSRGHSFHDQLENEIFNFGNVIGAFITYILVESLRPNEKMIPRFKRHTILIEFLHRAIDTDSIFSRFIRLLPSDSNADRLIMGLDSKSMDKITSAYNNVYSGLSEVLDYSFREYISFNTNKSCNHKWHRVDIHKVGKRLECRKCLGLVEEKDLEPIDH